MRLLLDGIGRLAFASSCRKHGQIVGRSDRGCGCRARAELVQQLFVVSAEMVLQLVVLQQVVVVRLLLLLLLIAIIVGASVGVEQLT